MRARKAAPTPASAPGPGSSSVAAPSETGTAWVVIAVAALTAVALVLRLSQLHQSLFGDELFTYDDVHGRTLAGSVARVDAGAESNPPLFFVLAWASSRLGSGPAWIRLPSVLLGTATVPLLYLLGRDWVGRKAGLIATTVVALSPFTLFYGVEARPYATMVFLVVLGTLALGRAVAARTPGSWALYVVAAAAAAYTHYASIFVLVVLAVWSLWACRDRLREPLAAHALAAAIYLPWLGHTRPKAVGAIGTLEPLGFHKVLQILAKPLAGYPYAPLREIPTVLGLSVIAACVAVGLAALVLPGRRGEPVDGATAWDRAYGRPSALVLLAALALATPVGLLVYSLTRTDLFLPRGLLASLPAAALVLGALLARLPRRLTAVTTLAIGAVLLTGTLRSVRPAHRRAAIEDVAQWINPRAGPGAAVIYVPFLALINAPPELRRDLAIYLPHRLHLLTLPPDHGLWPSLRRFPRVFVVGPRLPSGVFAPVPPPSEGRKRLVVKQVDGLYTYVIAVYGRAAPGPAARAAP